MLKYEFKLKQVSVCVCVCVYMNESLLSADSPIKAICPSIALLSVIDIHQTANI